MDHGKATQNIQRGMLMIAVYLPAIAIRLGRITSIVVTNSANSVKGLFGMNVDVLENNPSWVWYFALCLPIMASLVLVWIVFKFTNVGNISEAIISRYRMPNLNLDGENDREDHRITLAIVTWFWGG